MGLMDSLKRADEQARQDVTRSKETAASIWEDIQRRLRRQWRILPRRSAARAPSSPSAAADGMSKTA